MKQLQHVLWSKGTFLTPQHLQLQDRYVENFLQFHLESFAFRLWGFASLQIDQNKLLDGQFCLVEARGIFPDGLMFDIPEADQPPASRLMNEFFHEGHNQLAVFLSVPEQRENGTNIGSSSETKTRFVAESRMVRDENSGLSERPVQVARKNLRLLFEGENQEGSTVMQVAQVERSAAGTCKLVESFVPPLVDIQGNDWLRRIARGLLEILGARSSVLAGTRRQKNQNLADFSASDIANFWLLYTINQHLPLVRHLFQKRNAHPEQLFSVMLSLAGALTTFSTLIAPRDLPEYQHEQMGKCFTDLEQKIRLLLETVVPAHFVAIPLKLVQPSIYAASIDDDQYLRETRLYLAVSADIADDNLIGIAGRLLKVGTAAHVDEMIRQAVPGLKVTYVSNPPTEIPVKLRYKYFRLDATGKVWEGIQRARNIAVYAPSDLPNPKLELVILLPSKNEG